MRKKVMFGYDYTDNEVVKVLLYLVVGGTAALVEWALFYLFFYHLFAGFLHMGSLTVISTSAAFCCSTLYHYFLGNILVFDSGSKYNRKKELTLVFVVSVMGLLLNLMFMYVFVNMLGWEAMASKVLTSCICVVWNYLARKKWVFKS